MSTTITLPTELSQLLQSQANTEQQPLEEFVIKLLYETVETVPSKQQSPLGQQGFLTEVAAFEKLKPSLLKTHLGQVVAVYQEKVVAVGSSREAVLQEVTTEFGNVPCYIEWVEENVPRKIRFPAIRHVKR